MLAAYGRSPEQVPLVLQYNKRDLSDPYALEELHRKLGLRGAAAFEAVATEGSAVLQTLTTISKRVIRHRREQADRQAEEPAAAAPPSPPLGTTQLVMRMAEPEPAPEFEPENAVGLEPGLLAGDLEEEAALATTTAEPIFESLGEPRLGGPRSVLVPVRIRDAAGHSRELTLRIQIDALLEPTS